MNRKFLSLLLVLSMLLGCFAMSAYAEELSYDDLVAAAKAEGKLVLTGANSYLGDAAKLFEEEFGIEVEFRHQGETEMIQRLSEESKANSVTVDVACAQDTYRVTSDLLNPGYAMKWTNSRLADITGTDDATAVIWYYDTKMFMYNDELVGEHWLTNLWAIADPARKGLFTFKDPSSEGVNIDMMTMLTSEENAAKLAEAYREYFGEEIQLTTDNAGWELIKRLFENGVLLTTSDTTSATTIGAKGMDQTWIGYFSTQRFITQEAKDIRLAYDYADCKPFSGYAYPVYAIVLEGCAHPNAGKLFVEWLLSANGWKAFETYYGGFSANPANAYATPYSFDELKPYIVLDDADYLMETRPDVEDLIDGLR
ncbi:MAG: ABC transporter substrate-binding protein [Clostridia bacterium]|nr:ABC transporter substrate-binding protein [Clostridia bacterium]